MLDFLLVWVFFWFFRLVVCLFCFGVFLSVKSGVLVSTKPAVKSNQVLFTW